MNKYTKEFIEVVTANPDLKIYPFVNRLVVADDFWQYWMGEFGSTEISYVYKGKEHIHFKDEDQENVLADMVGCEYYCTPDGREITELEEEEWNSLFESLPWEKCIIVYIEV